MSQTLLVGPAAEPILLAQAKEWLRIDGSDEDDLVSTFIVSARLFVEQSARRLLMTQSWRIYRDAWPEDRFVLLPISPVASVSVIRVRDAAGATSAVDAETYRFDGAHDPPRIAFAAPPVAPTYPMAGVEIDVIAGYGEAADVPEPLRQAMRLLIARWYENRGDSRFGGGDLMAPPEAAALIAPFRRARLA